MFRRTFFQLFSFCPFSFDSDFNLIENMKSEPESNGKSYYDIVYDIMNKGELSEYDYLVIDFLIKEIINDENQKMALYVGSINLSMNYNIPLKLRSEYLKSLHELIIKEVNSDIRYSFTYPTAIELVSFEEKEKMHMRLMEENIFIAKNTYLYYNLLA